MTNLNNRIHKNFAGLLQHGEQIRLCAWVDDATRGWMYGLSGGGLLYSEYFLAVTNKRLLASMARAILPITWRKGKVWEWPLNKVSVEHVRYKPTGDTTVFLRCENAPWKKLNFDSSQREVAAEFVRLLTDASATNPESV